MTKFHRIGAKHQVEQREDGEEGEGETVNGGTGERRVPRAGEEGTEEMVHKSTFCVGK